MVTWSLRSSQSKATDHVYSRPLGLTEQAFYWDSVFNGTADSTEHLIVENKQPGNPVFSKTNVERAWISLKCRFPLLGASMEEHPDTEGVDVVVAESRLHEIRPHEVNISAVDSEDAARLRVAGLFSGPRTLSNDLLAQVFIFSRTDLPNYYHVVTHAAHAITDGTSNITIMRTFLHTLSSSVDYFIPPLEERLAMVVASDDLEQSVNYNVPRQRWRRAIASVIVSAKVESFKRGHTIPRTFTPQTLYTPARSCHTVWSFSPEQSELIVANCRKRKLTFGQVFPILGFIATTRLLFRRYLRGEINEEEWEYRKRQPMHTAGPLNLRPYLNKTWYEKGGGGEVRISVGFFNWTAPFMPLGSASRLPPHSMGDAPHFSVLLSHERFFLRCSMIAKQVAQFMGHPLFHEIRAARVLGRLAHVKAVALRWRNRQGDVQKTGSDYDVWYAADDPILSHNGSSFGNVDVLLPLHYPLPPTNPLSPRSNRSHPLKAGFQPFGASQAPPKPDTPILHVHSSATQLHCRPTELYLGAKLSRNRLDVGVFWDGNVFEEAIVKEWLGEIIKATEWYLVIGGGLGDQAKL